MSKRYYMHTIDGRAAFYDPRNQQIVYAEQRDHWKDDYPLVVIRETVEQIRDDQRKTRAFRKRMGYDPTAGVLDYVVLSLVPGWIKWTNEPEAPKPKAKRARVGTARARRA